jgi:hypothetical protein
MRNKNYDGSLTNPLLLLEIKGRKTRATSPFLSFNALEIKRRQAKIQNPHKIKSNNTNPNNSNNTKI